MDLLALAGFVWVLYFLIYFICLWFIDCNLQLAILEKYGKPISSLKDRVVWITGASSGIGEHLAYVLAKAGCKLILSARRKSELERVKQICLQNNADLEDDNILVLDFDICNVDLHQEIFEKIINKFGKLDILVNNAGRSQRAHWEDIDINVDREMFELNVFSQLSLSRIAIKYFLKNNGGHIVVTSSLAGILPVPHSGTYTGTKHALHGYFKSFVFEKINENISVTLICPGAVQTNFLAEAFTGKSGEKFGVNTDVASNKVSAERCATLMAVAIANKVHEAWISKRIGLLITYLTIYYPNVGFWFVRKVLGPQMLRRLRDAKNNDKL